MNNTLNDLVWSLKKYLSEFDSSISNIEAIYGPNRVGIFLILMHVLIKQKNI